MTTSAELHANQLTQFSRRGLWIALALVAALAAFAIILNLFPGSASIAQRGMTLLPMAIVIAIVAANSSLKGMSAAQRARGMQRVLGDELREQSVNTACRHGLLAVLIAQPVMAVVLMLVEVPYPVLLMASVTAFAGVATVLCSMLLLDR